MKNATFIGKFGTPPIKGTKSEVDENNFHTQLGGSLSKSTHYGPPRTDRARTMHNGLITYMESVEAAASEYYVLHCMHGCSKEERLE